jgi:hypothetical protein
MKSFCIKNILCDRKPLVYKYTYHGQTMRSLLIETREELLLIYIYNQIIPFYPLKRCYFEIYTQLNATFLRKCTLWQHFCTSVACLHPWHTTYYTWFLWIHHWAIRDHHPTQILDEIFISTSCNLPSGGALYIMFENHVRSWPLLKTP